MRINFHRQPISLQGKECLDSGCDGGLALMWSSRPRWHLSNTSIVLSHVTENETLRTRLDTGQATNRFLGIASLPCSRQLAAPSSSANRAANIGTGTDLLSDGSYHAVFASAKSVDGAAQPAHRETRSLRQRAKRAERERCRTGQTLNSIASCAPQRA
jgi:hypothetical protein